MSRLCDSCGKPMTEGYYYKNSEQYFCSDECLYTDGYTPEQKELDYKYGRIYWTELEDESKVYVLASELADHRANSVDINWLIDEYRENQFDVLSEYTAEELTRMIEQEINQ